MSSILTLIESIVHILQPAPRDSDAIECVRWIGNSMDHEVEWPGGGKVRIRVGKSFPNCDHREVYESCWGVRVDWESPDPDQSVRWEAYLDNDSEHTTPIHVICTLAKNGWHRRSISTPLENGIHVKTGPEYLQGYYGPVGDLTSVLESDYPLPPSGDTPFCIVRSPWQPEWEFPETTSLWIARREEPSYETMCQIIRSCPKLVQYRPSNGPTVYYRQSDGTWDDILPPEGLDNLWVHSASDLPLADNASRILVKGQFAGGLLHRYRDTHYHTISGAWCLLRPRRSSRLKSGYSC